MVAKWECGFWVPFCMFGKEGEVGKMEDLKLLE